MKFRDDAEILNKLLTEFNPVIEDIITQFAGSTEPPTEVQTQIAFVKALGKHKAINKITALFADKDPSEVSIVEVFGMFGFLSKLINKSVEAFRRESQ